MMLDDLIACGTKLAETARALKDFYSSDEQEQPAPDKKTSGKKASKKQESPAQTPDPAPQPESAKEYGFTVEDYDYLNMPQIGATTLIIMVTTDKGDNDGIVFESEDGGDTWKYRGVTQN